MASTALFPYVDAVINQASMTGVMAMLWDLPVISLDCSYNDWYCDSKNLGDLLDILGKGKVNKNNIIFWYLTRYALFDKRYNDSEFLENYFKNKFKKFDKGIKFDFYEEIEKFNDISDYILKKLNRETEKQRNRKTEKQTFIQKIFSITNIANHKMIYFLGFKFKFKYTKNK